MNKVIINILIFLVTFTAGALHTNRKQDVIEENLQEIDWWETASFYQIYPRSFKDSNGDGIGDLAGITEKLSYLKEIGITAVWISPIFKSPMKDFGYDISSFKEIQPDYGNMVDFLKLIAVAKSLGIKILLDFVPNHTSDKHRWFEDSTLQREPYRDFYIWHPGYPNPKDPNNRLPPSNWISIFRGSAWEWNDVRKEFYLHQFLKEQPDLNYRNPEVKKRMKDVLKFWMDRGVDGFRIDAVPHIFEVAMEHNDTHSWYPDEKPVNPSNPNDGDYNSLKHEYTFDQPETVELLYEWRQFLDEYSVQHNTSSKVLLAEAYNDIDERMKYYGDGEGREGVHVPFNFYLLTDVKRSTNAQDFENIINKWLNKMPEKRTANWVIGNHDNSRVATRLGIERADALNMILLSLPGISVTYYGEEIGMEDVWLSYEETVDPQACNAGPESFFKYTRDPERTPFQWSNEANAGFSLGDKTWLPVSPGYETVNVRRQRGVGRSHLNIYKRMQELRKTITFQTGQYVIKALNNDVLAILRPKTGNKKYITLVNLSKSIQKDLQLQSKLSGILNENLQYVVVNQYSNNQIGQIVPVDEVTLFPEEAVVLSTL